MSVILRKRKLKSGKTTLYLEYYQNGERTYEYPKLYLEPGKKDQNKEILRIAEGLRAKRQVQVQSDGYDSIPLFIQKADFLKYFESVAQSKTGNTRGSWGNTLNYLKACFPAGLPIQQLTAPKLQRFQEFLLDHVSQNSAQSYFGKVKAALRQAVKDRLIARNPADQIESIPKTKTNPVFLTEKELFQLAKTPLESQIKTRGRLELIGQAFLFSCFTGIRFSDIKQLTWEGLHGDQLEFIQIKTKSPVTVYLNETALALLPMVEDKQGIIFDLPVNNFVNRTLKDWAKRAGIKKNLTFHMARHTFATLTLSKSPGELYTLSKLLGHASIQATQIYAQVVEENKRQMVSKLPKLQIGKGNK